MSDPATQQGAGLTALVRAHLEDRNLTFVTDDTGEVFGIPFGREAGEQADVTVALDTAPSDGPTIRAEARGNQRFPRDRWAAVLWGVNAWNARVELPRARLHVDEERDDGEVVLDGWLPVGARPDPAAVALFCDRFLARSVAFWMPPDDATPADTSDD